MSQYRCGYEWYQLEKLHQVSQNITERNIFNFTGSSDFVVIVITSSAIVIISILLYGITICTLSSKSCISSWVEPVQLSPNILSVWIELNDTPCNAIVAGLYIAWVLPH